MKRCIKSDNTIGIDDWGYFTGYLEGNDSSGDDKVCSGTFHAKYASYVLKYMHEWAKRQGISVDDIYIDEISFEKAKKAVTIIEVPNSI